MDVRVKKDLFFLNTRMNRRKKNGEKKMEEKKKYTEIVGEDEKEEGAEGEQGPNAGAGRRKLGQQACRRTQKGRRGTGQRYVCR